MMLPSMASPRYSSRSLLSVVFSRTDRWESAAVYRLILPGLNPIRLQTWFRKILFLPLLKRYRSLYNNSDYEYFFTISDALCPPNPKVLLNAALTIFC